MNTLNPLRSEIKPGHWVVLRNNWLVGPVVASGDEGGSEAVCVKFGTGTWAVFGRDEDVPWDDTRRVQFSGPKDKALDFIGQCFLADEIIDEILEEERLNSGLT